MTLYGPLRPWQACAGAVWLVLVLSGSAMMWRYGSTAGAPGAPPATWPAASNLPLASDVPTLVMLVHPMCPCSRASLDELEVVMSRAAGRARAYVVFVRPPGVTDDWRSTDYWHKASSIPGTTPVVDEGGAEAHALGSLTSGHVLLYAPGGRLLYSGGITGARGHEGDNEGRRDVLALIADQAPTSVRRPVYGCGLDDPERARELTTRTEGPPR
jgi:hypothetical protein